MLESDKAVINQNLGYEITLPIMISDNQSFRWEIEEKQKVPLMLLKVILKLHHLVITSSVCKQLNKIDHQYWH